jgi:hypothetical protein
MKTSLMVAVILACTLSAPITSAQQEPAPAKQAMSMDMDSLMQENMEKMQQQMDKLRATTDAGERQKLMREHMQAMQENMTAMRGMGGPQMMGGQNGGAMMDADPKQRQEIMEKRMDMMQMMMEQMMQHNQMMGAMPAK